MAGDEDAQIEFCTLGMFIIDDIHFLPPTPPVTNILGGAGSYSALGARIFSPPPLSRSVGWIVDCGSDFPPELRDVIARWETGCLMRETPHRLTTRGWNGYGENEHRAFKYITPKLRLDHDALTPQLLMSKSFHLICSPTRCIDLVKNILDRRSLVDKSSTTASPLFIWEPVPDLCIPQELGNCIEALKCVDVVSPNHAELAGFFGRGTMRNGELDRNVIHECCNEWLSAGIGKDGHDAIVVRAGKEGSYIASNNNSQWLPAYHQSASKVTDPTGGGNGFLGGLAIGLARGKPLQEAAIWGTISASFAIEQVGMPVLARTSEGETWNGVRVQDRLEEYSKRLEGYVQW